MSKDWLLNVTITLANCSIRQSAEYAVKLTGLNHALKTLPPVIF
jgi:hypothetical protein